MLEEAVYSDERLAVRAIARQEIDHMRACIGVYRDTPAFTDVETWSCRCTMPPLALAIEVPGYRFHNVLNVLVQEVGVDLSAPYEIIDQVRNVRIRTTALTHVLARWDHQKTECCRDGVATALIQAGADATAPALYVVTPLMTRSSSSTRALREAGADESLFYEFSASMAAASGQSLLAFQLSQRLERPTPFYFVSDYITFGGACFRATDPAALFVTALSLADTSTKHRFLLHRIIEFLCPLDYGPHVMPRFLLCASTPVGRLLLSQPTGCDDLKRIVCGVDTAVGMNILHCYAAHGVDLDVRSIMVRVRALRDVYGLDLLQLTSDGRTLSMLVAGITTTDIARQNMHTGVMRVLDEDVFAPRHLALAAAQALRALPPLAMHLIGRHARLPMLGAHELDERLRGGRKSSQ
jgi:hypothetical protein